MDPSVTISQAPEWVEGVKWIFAALLLAIAVVGPSILGPLINKFKQNLAAPSNLANVGSSPTIATGNMAVVGGALADKDAIIALSKSIDRLCDIMERRVQREEDKEEEDDLQRRIKEAMKELAKS